MILGPVGFLGRRVLEGENLVLSWKAMIGQFA